MIGLKNMSKKRISGDIDIILKYMCPNMIQNMKAKWMKWIRIIYDLNEGGAHSMKLRGDILKEYKDAIEVYLKNEMK
jgi:hypothetical protein